MLFSMVVSSIVSRTWCCVDIGAHAEVRNDGVLVRRRVLAGRGA